MNKITSFSVAVLLSVTLGACHTENIENKQDQKPFLYSETIDLKKLNLLQNNQEEIEVRFQSFAETITPLSPYTLEMHVTFADVDIDGVPEIFYGFQSVGSQPGIWYRIYSLADCNDIVVEHKGMWTPYYDNDKLIAIPARPENFLENKFYIDQFGQPYVCSYEPVGSIANPGVRVHKLLFYDGIWEVASSEIIGKNVLEEPTDQSYPLVSVSGIVRLENIMDDLEKMYSDYMQQVCVNG